jgi:CRISPR-associated protein Cmr3
MWCSSDDLPFGARGSQMARCTFPPRPSVIAGALRTKVLAAEGVDFDRFREGAGIPEAVRREIGAGRGAAGGLEGGTFAVCQLLLGNRTGQGDGTPYFRPGRDLVAPKKKGGDRAEGKEEGAATTLRVLGPARSRSVSGVSSLGDALVPLAIEPGCEPQHAWLKPSAWLSYLLARASTIRKEDLAREADILSRDYRVGIGLDTESRTVEEGKLFSSEGVVMRPGWGFVAGVEGCAGLPTTGLVRLGGDGRMARLSAWSVPEPDWSPVRDAIATTGRFRWVLQTPAIFRGGWQPESVHQEGAPLVYRRNGVAARLVSAAVGSPELAGGWDLVRGAPKPFRRMVPAGSVYWFELLEGKPEGVWELFHNRSVSDEKAKEGFGLVQLGGWDYV